MNGLMHFTMIKRLIRALALAGAAWHVGGQFNLPGQSISGPNLVIRDNETDRGARPNLTTTDFYLSPDIWIRRQPDPNYSPRPFSPSLSASQENPVWEPQPHEGPCYRDPKFSLPNYIYVRVGNEGSMPSTGQEILHVYWAKAATALAWPEAWNDRVVTITCPDGRVKRYLYGFEVTKPRKSAHRATAAEIADYVNAVRMIDTAAFSFPDGRTYFDKQNMIHQLVNDLVRDEMGNPIRDRLGRLMGGDFPAHGGIPNVGTPRFGPWHREMMARYEALLREVAPDVTLLYWDFTEDPSPIMLGESGFMGSANGTAGTPFASFRDQDGQPLVRRKPGTPPGEWPSPSSSFFTSEHEDSLLAIRDRDRGFSDGYQRFVGWLEATSHNLAHLYLGGNPDEIARRDVGQMTWVDRSATDPLFFMLHANIDRLWAMWQRQDTARWHPETAYGSLQGDARITSFLQPWAGMDVASETGVSAGPAAAAVSPWISQNPGDPDGYVVYKSSTHHSIVYPPIYDDVPLRVPVLQPGQQCIIEIPFYPPPLTECAPVPDPSHLCLLARIEVPGVPLVEGADLTPNARNNPGVAWRNVSLDDCTGREEADCLMVGADFFCSVRRIGSGGEMIRNPRPTPQQVSLRFVHSLRPGGRSLFQFGGIRLRLQQNLFDAWDAGGRQGAGVEWLGGTEVRVLGSGALLAGMRLGSQEFGRMDLALELNPGYPHPGGETFQFGLCSRICG